MTAINAKVDVETTPRSSQALLEQAIESISDAFVLYDADGRLVMCNQKHLDFFPHMAGIYRRGISRKEVIRAHAEVRRMDDPSFDFEAYFEERVKQVLQPRDDCESQLIDGRWVAIRERMVSGGGLVSIRTDITEKKRAEKELEEHRDHLQELVDIATRRLRIRAENLEQALEKEQELSEMQRQFVSMANHEIRTPLAVIDAAAQRMQRKADRDQLAPGEAAAKLDTIRSAVDRMTHLMESTLNAARMQDGKIGVVIEDCDIEGVIKRVCKARQEITKTHLILCETKDLPKTILADPSSVEQLLNNLLSNAIKFSPGDPRVEVTACADADHVVISVRDFGIGIDQEDQPRIGERFFRAKTSTGIPGTGIGLNLAMTLVTMHGGSMDIESQKGAGSRFSIRLPNAGPKDLKMHQKLLDELVNPKAGSGR